MDDDPLTLALSPPPNETPEERENRLRDEAEARKISEDIDEEIKAQRLALKKKPHVKVLLLGQSESDFQIAYSQEAWKAELLSWRTVIQWNLLRNVQLIIELLDEEMSRERAFSEDEDSGSDNDETSTNSAASPPPRRGPIVITEKHRLLKLQLLPLRQVQRDVEERLGASSHEIPAQDEWISQKQAQELFVRSNNRWKATLLPGRRSSDMSTGMPRRNREAEANQTTDILAGSAQAIKSLWEDETVQELLRRRRVRMDALPGFFISDVMRIARRDYVPTNEDVVRARLRTLGVQEHHIHFDTGPAAGMDWILYDVGGSRTQRAAWTPYFDDCDAIIFLAPISCFDEKLAEDKRVNRLEDSYTLWKTICSSKLLAKAQIILFLNKCDLLEKKLRAGVQVKDYVPSFGKRKNDAQTVSQYFAQHFKEIAKTCSPQPRPFRVHLTSVIDTKATAVTLHTGKSPAFSPQSLQALSHSHTPLLYSYETRDIPYRFMQSRTVFYKHICVAWTSYNA
ncbi:G-protein alpha subunit [Cristinia sonorae]|uniref:G-protein alpha subunit n=1 Tax=Cristinia sonorae TaxID=1940300 RepID=A0A8K0UHK2_9AGAR|nr:G-protein alpha subunit [Cristinia sonorae]